MGWGMRLVYKANDRKRQIAEQNTSATFHTTAFYRMSGR